MMMDKREKVIKELQRCVLPHGRGCTPECEYHGRIECCRQVMRKAIALLKEQEPRVLTLDAYKAMAEKPRNEKSPVWEELRYSNSSEWGWALPQQAYDGYGIVWRAWTDKPTEEQREAEAW